MSEDGTTKEQRESGELSRAYSDLASETVPPALDEKVLGLAKAARPRIALKWNGPIAVAATVTICFALLLQLGEEPQYPENGSWSPDTAAGEQTATESPQAANGRNAAPATAPAQKLLTVPMQTTAESAADSDLAGASREESALPEPDSNFAAPGCSDISRGDPQSWWQCVTELREAGLGEKADDELRLLIETFPDFAPPM